MEKESTTKVVALIFVAFILGVLAADWEDIFYGPEPPEMPTTVFYKIEGNVQDIDRRGPVVSDKPPVIKYPGGEYHPKPDVERP